MNENQKRIEGKLFRKNALIIYKHCSCFCAMGKASDAPGLV